MENRYYINGNPPIDGRNILGIFDNTLLLVRFESDTDSWFVIGSDINPYFNETREGVRLDRESLQRWILCPEIPIL